MTALFAIPCVAIAIYAICQYTIADTALKKLVPGQLSEGLSEKFVLGALGLSPLTPLPIQTNYMNALWAGTVAMLCLSLTLFSLGERFGGWLGLMFFLVGVVSTVRSWKTYNENRNRKVVHRDVEEP
jgi:hypothetical protein